MLRLAEQEVVKRRMDISFRDLPEIRGGEHGRGPCLIDGQ